jgi:hypothetical protein
MTLPSFARTRAWVVGIGSAPGGARTERSPAMPGTTKHDLSEEERAERRRADREYARQAVEQLRSSEGWRRWLATRRHFHAYSFANQLLIAMARPTATRVAYSPRLRVRVGLGGRVTWAGQVRFRASRVSSPVGQIGG